MRLEDFCRVLEVSPSGYYAWKARQKRPAKSRSLVTEQTIIQEMKAFRQKHRFTPGIRQFHAYLQAKLLRVGIRRLRDVLRSKGFIGYRRRTRVKTTDSNHCLAVHPNLLSREFQSGEINRAWVSDITYLPTQEGFVYLASIIDLGSRRLLGWALDTSMPVDLVQRALDQALKTRGKERLPGTILHSDQGSQYCSHVFQNRVRAAQMRTSMSRKGECWDNAVAESFWNTVKREVLGARKRFLSISEAIEQTENWISYYNAERPHSAIRMMASLAYEAQLSNR